MTRRKFHWSLGSPKPPISDLLIAPRGGIVSPRGQWPPQFGGAKQDVGDAAAPQPHAP